MTDRESPTIDRRTTLQIAAASAIAPLSISRVSAGSSTPPVGDIVFEDDFEDGVLDWTDLDHPEFWTETNGRIQYTPSTSAGETGNNTLYADATFDGDQGLLEWPVAIELKAKAIDPSSHPGASIIRGGAKKDHGDSKENQVLSFGDSAYHDRMGVTNSQNESFTTPDGTGGETGTWYTYRVVPDLDANVIHLYRDGDHYTFPRTT